MANGLGTKHWATDELINSSLSESPSHCQARTFVVFSRVSSRTAWNLLIATESTLASHTQLMRKFPCACQQGVSHTVFLLLVFISGATAGWIGSWKEDLWQQMEKVFYRSAALPVIQPTVSNHWRNSKHWLQPGKIIHWPIPFLNHILYTGSLMPLTKPRYVYRSSQQFSASATEATLIPTTVIVHSGICNTLVHMLKSHTHLQSTQK